MGVDDFMPAICWTKYFVAAQGYNVKDDILHQENNSFTILDNNRKAQSRKGTKHINIWYFFITDIFKNGEVPVVWCPTGYMIGDYMTKSLQGDTFRNFRDQIVGFIPAEYPGPVKVKVDHIIKA